MNGDYDKKLQQKIETYSFDVYIIALFRNVSVPAARDNRLVNWSVRLAAAPYN